MTLGRLPMFENPGGFIDRRVLTLGSVGSAVGFSAAGFLPGGGRLAL